MPDEVPAGLAVAIDREACLGTGMCIVYAPQTFAHDDETKAVLQDPPHDAAADVAGAVEACPVGALALRHPSAAEG
ncbi:MULTISPECIES: ferredoxin [unclassified Blastococcus]